MSKRNAGVDLLKLQDLYWLYTQAASRQECTEDKYSGMKECMRNVVRCNTAGKLSYCLPAGAVCGKQVGGVHVD